MSPVPEPGQEPADSPRGLLLSVLATVVVSTNFITAKYGLRGFNPESFSMVWTGAAALFSLMIVTVSGRSRRLAVNAGEVGPLVALGALTAAAMLLSWSGLALLDPSFVAFLWRFEPVLMILLGVVFLGERLSKAEVPALGLMVAGGAVSALGRWEVVGAGVVLSLLSRLATAGAMVVAKSRSRMSAPILVFYRSAIAFVLISLWTIATGKMQLRVDGAYWAVTFLGALLGPCASHLLAYRALKYWDLSRYSIVTTLQPLLVLPMAYVLLHKLPSDRELLGGLLILTGALWVGAVSLRRRSGFGRPDGTPAAPVTP